MPEDAMLPLILLIGGLLGALYFGFYIGADVIPFAICSFIGVLGWHELREGGD